METEGQVPQNDDGSAAATGAPAAPATPPAAVATPPAEGQPAAPQGEGQPAAPTGEQQPQGEPAQPQGEAQPIDFDSLVPEGAVIDEQTATDFKAVAKELNMTQDQAKTLIGLQARLYQSQAEAQQQQVETWANQVREDREIGGEKLQQNLTVAQKAIREFGDESLVSLLNESGLGNHPALVRFALKVGKALGSDTFVSGAQGAAAPSDPASRLFPDMTR